MPFVRIIGGSWRSRRIFFPEIPGLRPTQDRIRETLFNWLMPVIPETKCLDLFAGSGVLGWEALSRGAKHTCFVDKNRKVVQQLYNSAETLRTQKDQFEIFLTSDWNKLSLQAFAPFDIVFLDPPFHQNLLSKAVDWLIENNLVHSGSLIYMEMEKDLELLLPRNWIVTRKQLTATLIYQLVRAEKGQILNCE
ncbi:MAG: 16S rRNA (guanine(966)-N(2))-methyltransferase RsmD [Proteobacteria bacterium]|nr:16S rRNA (guanine(966)-N(2))-methyltransferase RsmD [Pseudomonadota bacterium]